MKKDKHSLVKEGDHFTQSIINIKKINKRVKENM